MNTPEKSKNSKDIGKYTNSFIVAGLFLTMLAVYMALNCKVANLPLPAHAGFFAIMGTLARFYIWTAKTGKA